MQMEIYMQAELGIIVRFSIFTQIVLGSIVSSRSSLGNS